MSVKTQPSSQTAGAGARRVSGVELYYLLFFVSGIPALLYQIVWQRALFTIYGVNIESVTVIVTVFMLGLGLGSLAGGQLSKRSNIPLLGIFGAIELAIGVFGAISLRIFHAVASSTAGASTVGTGLTTFALLLAPTLLMGCTLPLLVVHVSRRNANIGEAVGALYSVNTLGSAAACFLGANYLMRRLGESGCVQLAAAINACVALAALLGYFKGSGEQDVQAAGTSERYAKRPAIPFLLALLLAAAIGFIALGYEIVWYRIYSFVSGRTASSFASLLGWYLSGVAYGSYVVWGLCRGRLRANSAGLLRATATTVIWGNAAAFLVAPALALTIGYNLVFPFVFVGAALLGAAFPLISHASIDPGAPDAGARLSYLYLGNILGCTCGSFFVGFVLMDRLSTQGISLALFSAGIFLSCILVFAGRLHVWTWSRALSFVSALLLVSLSWSMYPHLYERLLFKTAYSRNKPFKDLVETRSGVVTVTDDGRVFGGGVYDGHVSTSLVHDVNGIFRAFALDALHPNPKEVLMIGLSMGSWAQVIASNPRVAKLTIVEINPGYLQVIPRYPEVASILHNPKVEMIIDDGRRWLIRNPARTFDVIVMNTSQHWLAHVSALLSAEFLHLIRPHLKPGGIHYYNTTFSPEAVLTGVTAFPYALRVGNFLAVSDTPVTFDNERWRTALLHYQIDGKAVFDLKNSLDRTQFNEVLSIGGTLHDRDATKGMRIETGESMRARFKTLQVITDDNMGSEWP